MFVLIGEKIEIIFASTENLYFDVQMHLFNVKVGINPAFKRVKMIVFFVEIQ